MLLDNPALRTLLSRLRLRPVRSANQPAELQSRSWPFLQLSASMLVACAIPLAGCGSMSPPMTPPPPPSPTPVNLLLTSTANDKLVQFDLSIVSITLFDKAGNSVTLFKNANLGTGSIGATEFMHLNGVLEPLVTASVAQGSYTAAIVTAGYCDLTYVTDTPTSGLEIFTDADLQCGQGTTSATVNLPSPITISGSGMALSLNLQVAQSYTLTGTGASATYTISPVFTLQALPISSQPSTEQNGRITGIDAQIISVNATGEGFMAKQATGFLWT